MAKSISSIWICLLSMSVFLLPLAVVSQEAGEPASDHDPEYDDEVAAGVPTYSDDEAAGPPEYSDDVAAGAEASGQIAADALSAQLSGAAAGESTEEQPKTARDELSTWEWGAQRHHSNLRGTTGLLHIVEAGSDDAGTFGTGVHGAYFYYTQYLIPQDEQNPADENTYMWGDLNARITPFEFLEIYGGMQAMANHNTREYPRLFQTIGDMDFGIKGFYELAPWVTVGAIASVRFMNAVGDMTMGWDGTSYGFDALASFDIAEITPEMPVRAHLNAGYFFDNAANLIADLEERRGGCGTPTGQGDEVTYKGCMSPVERFALQIDRNDQLRIGVGIDMALPYVTPIVEYRLEIPVNRQDFICPDIPETLSVDRCMAERGAAGFRQVITFGTRILLPVESLAIDLGLDVGISGYAPTVQELAAEVPYRILFGASYNFDPFPDPPVLPPAEPCPEIKPPDPPPAIIAGKVHHVLSAEKPIPGAVITYEGQPVTPQITDASGQFRSYPLPAGEITVAVQANGYHAETFTVTVPQTGEVALACPLREIPKKSTVVIHVSDEAGKAMVGADVTIDGPTRAKAVTGVDGTVEKEVDGGQYIITVEKEGYFNRRSSLELKVETRTEVRLMLNPKPKNPRVVVRDDRIRIKQKIHFETDSAAIKSDSFGLMDEIAHVIIANPDIQLVEIQGHTDNRGKVDYNVDLSERRARSVRRYLIDAGVSSARLEAKGYGPKRPKAPNITRTGRARNRRVEFQIIQRTPQPE